jgi:hypothetical protein
MGGCKLSPDVSRVLCHIKTILGAILMFSKLPLLLAIDSTSIMYSSHRNSNGDQKNHSNMKVAMAAVTGGITDAICCS